jgi:hypothetical protein
MANYTVRETFFRPEVCSRQESALPADLYNALQLSLKGQASGCVFVPLRALQYQAVVEREEVIFVDNHGGYAYQDGQQAGRLIRIAWDLTQGVIRASLSDPVPYQVLFYAAGLKETQWRLIGEMRAALQRMKGRDQSQPPAGRRVLPLRRTD